MIAGRRAASSRKKARAATASRERRGTLRAASLSRQKWLSSFLITTLSTFNPYHIQHATLRNLPVRRYQGPRPSLRTHRRRLNCSPTQISVASTHAEQIICHCESFLSVARRNCGLKRSTAGTDCQLTSGSHASTNILPLIKDVTLTGKVTQYDAKAASGNTGEPSLPQSWDGPRLTVSGQSRACSVAGAEVPWRTR